MLETVVLKPGTVANIVVLRLGVQLYYIEKTKNKKTTNNFNVSIKKDDFQDFRYDNSINIR